MHAWLIQGTEAAEKYYKWMLDEGCPPSKGDAEALAIAAQDGALRELIDCALPQQSPGPLPAAGTEIFASTIDAGGPARAVSSCDA